MITGVLPRAHSNTMRDLQAGKKWCTLTPVLREVGGTLVLV